MLLNVTNNTFSIMEGENNVQYNPFIQINFTIELLVCQYPDELHSFSFYFINIYFAYILLYYSDLFIFTNSLIFFQSHSICIQ